MGKNKQRGIRGWVEERGCEIEECSCWFFSSACQFFAQQCFFWAAVNEKIKGAEEKVTKALVEKLGYFLAQMDQMAKIKQVIGYVYVSVLIKK